MILELLPLVSWIGTKYTFIEIISEDTIALHGKNDLQHLYIRTRNFYIYWDENVSHCAPKVIPLCTGKYRHYFLGIFHQLLYTNQYFLNTNLVLSHKHTLTNTSLKIPFHLWAIVSQTRDLAISIIWNIWMSNKNSSQKSKAKLKTVIINLF